jgi:hypothetical protein
LYTLLLTSLFLNLMHMNKIQVNKLIDKVNEYFSVDMRDKTRKRDVIDIRHTFMYSLRNRGYKTAEIGGFLDKDHATVIHASRKVRDLILVERDMSRLVAAMDEVIDSYILEEKIYSRGGNVDNYESVRVNLCRVLEKFCDSEEERAHWLSKSHISIDEYKSFTSRFL